LPISFTSAARPAPSPAPPPHSNGRLAPPVSSILRTCPSTALPSQSSARSGTSGAILSASAGTPYTAASTSTATATTLQPTTFIRLRRSRAPERSTGTDASSIAVASAGSRPSSRAGTAAPISPSRNTPDGATRWSSRS